MTLEELQEHIRDLIADAGSQRELAKQLGVSASYLSDVLAGNREPGDKLLLALGLTREVRYVRRPRS